MQWSDVPLAQGLSRIRTVFNNNVDQVANAEVPRQQTQLAAPSEVQGGSRLKRLRKADGGEGEAAARVVLQNDLEDEIEEPSTSAVLSQKVIFHLLAAAVPRTINIKGLSSFGLALQAADASAISKEATTPNRKAPPRKAVVSPTQESDQIEDSDKEGALAAPHPIAGAVMLPI